jgi:hypothetical protein
MFAADVAARAAAAAVELGLQTVVHQNRHNCNACLHSSAALHGIALYCCCVGAAHPLWQEAVALLVFVSANLAGPM